MKIYTRKNNLICIFLILVIVLQYIFYNYYNSDSTGEPLNSYKKQKITTSQVKRKRIGSKNQAEINKTIFEFYNSFPKSEFKVYSQNNEDGVINHLMKLLNLSYSGYYVEFGCGDGTEINTRYLQEKFNWSGLLMTGHNENKERKLHYERVTHSNVIELFQKYNVPIEFELFSEDTDYADYWIVEAVLKVHRPKVVVHEVNKHSPDLCISVLKPEKLTFFETYEYFGATTCAFYCLAKQFKYTMIYCESKGVNCFWIRNDLLKELLDIDISHIHKILTPNFLYDKDKSAYHSMMGRQWHIVNCKI